MAASVRLSRAVSLLLRRSVNIRLFPHSSPTLSATFLKDPALVSKQFTRLLSSTQIAWNEQQTSQGVRDKTFPGTPVNFFFSNHNNRRSREKRISGRDANASGYCC